jgi:serine/threonine protein kinase/uncharacterized membrane protein
VSAEESDRSPEKPSAEEPDRSSGNSHYFALAKGTKLLEFEVQEVLGHGGFGITYLAMDTHLQEQVAIKEYLPNDLAVRASSATVQPKSASSKDDFDAGLKTFLEEARLVAKIRHPNIIRVRRFFEFQGTGYIVQDYEEGSTLGQRLSKSALSDSELRVLLSKVLDGLELVHERAVLHRDIKPSNIMLRKDGIPVLIDFGAARDFAARHSRSVTAIATPGYTPPEQFGVGGEQGPWTDIYALGAVMYRCVSGKVPVDSLRRLRTDSLVPASTAAEGKYDPALLRLIDWMMKIEESERPASVKAVREALNSIETGAGSRVAAEIGNLRSKSPSEIKRVGPGRAIIELPKSIDADVLELAFFADPPGKYLGFSPKDKASWRVKPHYFEIYSTKGNPEFSTFEIGAKIVNALPANSQIAVSSADGHINVSSKWSGEEASKTEEAKPKVSPALWRNIAIGAAAALILILGFFVLYKRDEANYLAAQHSQDAITLYLRNCTTFCFSREKAQARLDEFRGRAELDRWAKRLRDAGTNISALERFLQDCGSSCPSMLREQATKLRDEQRSAAAEQQDYNRARGNLSLLRQYRDNCKACVYKPTAIEEIARLERIDSERAQYLNARGILPALRRYVQDCQICADAPAARDEIARLDREAQFFTFTVCNKSRYKASVAISGRKDPASDSYTIIGWYVYEPGECTNLGKWAKGSFYFMAQQYNNQYQGWRGNDTKFCVTNRAFNRIRISGYTCQAGERLEGFFWRNLSDDFTWNLGN